MLLSYAPGRAVTPILEVRGGANTEKILVDSFLNISKIEFIGVTLVN